MGVKFKSKFSDTVFTLVRNDFDGDFLVAWEDVAAGGRGSWSSYTSDEVDQLFKEEMWYYIDEDTTEHWDSESEECEEEVEDKVDKGSHYRYSFRLNLTEEDKQNGFVNVNVDPYRISEVYQLGGWQEHVVKKTLRGTNKGHSTEELIEELQCCIDRAKQMLEESRE